VIARWLTGFGRFWYDFIVGDSKVLAIGAPLVLALAYLAAHDGAPRLGELIIPIGIATTLAVSLLRE
jgi:hypothetical protein